MIATSGQAKVTYDVTGGGKDDRPPVLLLHAGVQAEVDRPLRLGARDAPGAQDRGDLTGLAQAHVDRHDQGLEHGDAGERVGGADQEALFAER